MLRPVWRGLGPPTEQMDVRFPEEFEDMAHKGRVVEHRQKENVERQDFS